MLRAYFSNQFGVNASEDDYRFVFEQVRAHILSNGTEAETPLFTHFDKDNGVLQLSAGDKEVFRISDSGVKGVLNGHDGVLFRNADIAPIKRVSQGGAEAFGFVLSLPNFKGGAHLSVAQQDLIYELHFWSLLFSTLLKSQRYCYYMAEGISKDEWRPRYWTRTLRSALRCQRGRPQPSRRHRYRAHPQTVGSAR